MKLDRSVNTLRNSFWGMINKLVTLICPFLIRTIIIYALGTKYAGLHSLFTSIINMLSLMELGFGTAMVYSMYQPIASDDTIKIRALMLLYKKVYRMMGWIVLAIGIGIIPFLPVLINDTLPCDVNIYWLYCIYLANSVISYWLFAYRNCLLVAFQRNDIANKISTVSYLLMYTVQIIVLLCTENYYLYIICLPVCTILTNYFTSWKVSKIYPQYYCEGSISQLEKKEIKRQVVGLLAQRLAHMSRNAFDSIIISSFLGLTIVSIYNNYFFVLNAVTAILSLVFVSMQGGLGNTVAKDSVEKVFRDFRKIKFLYMWIAGWCSICIFVLIQPFMELWMNKELMFSAQIVAMLAFYFYAMKMTDPVGAYVGATGLWWKCRYVYLIEAGTNLALNIGLGYLYGIEGIIIATIISVIIVNYVSNIYILCKYYFGARKLKVIIFDDLVYLFAEVVALLITILAVSPVKSGDTKESLFLDIVIKFAICCGVPNLVYMLSLKRTNQYQSTIPWIKERIIRNVRRNTDRYLLRDDNREAGKYH